MNWLKLKHRTSLLLAGAFLLTILIYWPGMTGGFLFDDFPNIVDNPGVRPTDASLPSLIRAALSSPSSDFKRPLASLSFAANYLAAGLNPYWMKVTNLVIHLANGFLVFVLSRRILAIAAARFLPAAPREAAASSGKSQSNAVTAALITAGWLLLPINLTSVLYIVQRMESLANLFVLLGLVGYIGGRVRMLAPPRSDTAEDAPLLQSKNYWQGLLLSTLAIAVCTFLGVLAKETGVMLPLYAFFAEWVLFNFRRPNGKPDPVIFGGFAAFLLLPLLVGLSWLLPPILQSAAWSTRNFTMATRLLSESRIICDYIQWTLLPTPNGLSFYHDDFRVSTGLLSPWTTLASITCLVALTTSAVLLRRSRPLVSLGLLFFLGSHLLTGTILPLELIYEHRNYFASFGLLLAVIPLMTGSPQDNTRQTDSTRNWALPRITLLVGLLALWASITAMTAMAWSSPLRLAVELAARAPDSPRAQYELGRTYIIHSNYAASSPFTKLAYAPLERAAKLPGASVLPEQALIFMNSRMHLPIKDTWWDSMIDKLKAHPPGVQDESALYSLVHCMEQGQCELQESYMTAALDAAISHSTVSARVLNIYATYYLNVKHDPRRAIDLLNKAVTVAPREPAYRITLVRLLALYGSVDAARGEFEELTPAERMSLDPGVYERLDKCLATRQTTISCYKSE